ncbi:sigma-G-dependent sporulation-specific acid-soluble spore protein CsgA [Halalkalibacter oceani]|uniref:Sigma-G-dependent sporulation-specific acid-soluble spore protein CsgA n=1 Tax=Halalkalibacter oceani TaxID=1653776 RepID=A0A9X2IPW6_9BACI|nr:sigma-G-dependent sporulation-specific acid-soluble spore protein CsgA [Halalkalibacter oceani]MCM3716449.1 sigma-G-dependent sporulation-specific acid-soluble spore protein CsgA [Halalkalibacter oceani]MCM3760948.1 sigma-G-dependent sporulation-specific acid-soluble spore protein CsgA [Halalkalibacter oceani]
MDTNLAYLRESLSNHLENHPLCQHMYDKLEQSAYKDEEQFVRSLNEQETEILNLILRAEINYARQEEDQVREEQLIGVYELLI